MQAACLGVETILGLTLGQVIPVDAPGQRPAYAHIGVQLVGNRIVSQSGKLGTGGAYTTTVQREATILLTAYGADAVGWLDTVADDWLTKKAGPAAMRTAGLHPLTKSETRDLSTDVDGEWEPRRGLTVTASHRTDRPSVTLPYVTEIVIDMDIQPGAHSVAASSTEAP